MFYYSFKNNHPYSKTKTKQKRVTKQLSICDAKSCANGWEWLRGIWRFLIIIIILAVVVVLIISLLLSSSRIGALPIFALARTIPAGIVNRQQLILRFVPWISSSFVPPTSDQRWSFVCQIRLSCRKHRALSFAIKNCCNNVPVKTTTTATNNTSSSSSSCCCCCLFSVTRDTDDDDYICCRLKIQMAHRCWKNRYRQHQTRQTKVKNKQRLNKNSILETEHLTASQEQRSNWSPLFASSDEKV